MIIEPSHNYHDHYQNVLCYYMAVWILVTQSITSFEADWGQTFLSEAFQSWAQMNCHLVPNCHNSQHFIEYILMYGPIYGWWVWAYEWSIGILSKIKNNGHDSGEIESTYMRAWWKMILFQELVCHVFGCHVDWQDWMLFRSLICKNSLTVHQRMMKLSIPYTMQWKKELKLSVRNSPCSIILQHLLSHTGSTLKVCSTWLGFFLYTDSSIHVGTVQFPYQSSHIKNLQSVNLYILILCTLQLQYPQMEIISNSDAAKKGIMLQSHHVRSYGTTTIRGIKYGASTHHCGQKCCFAYVHECATVRIEYILSVFIP